MDVRRFASALFVLTLIPAAGMASPVVGQEAGVIEGTLLLRLGAQRRWASRYPGAGPTSAKVHPVPAVVYLLGNFPEEGPVTAVREIVQRDGVFLPGALVVRAGTVVRFPNEDSYFHNVFSYADPRFDLGRYPQGESREVLFDAPGIVRVRPWCTSSIPQLSRTLVVRLPQRLLLCRSPLRPGPLPARGIQGGPVRRTGYRQGLL